MSLDMLMDTPRIYTALAEWGSCLVYLLLLRRKVAGRRFALALAAMLAVFILYQTVAGMLPIWFWIPTMLGASALKIFKYFKDYGLGFTANELLILLTGMIVAFLVSVLVIRLFMGFIRKHDFKPFGWYRIALGAVILVLFFCNVLTVTPA